MSENNLLIDQLKHGFDKKRSPAVAKEVLSKPQKLDCLMSILFEGELRSNQRCGWILEVIAKQTPTALYPYLDTMLVQLQKNPTEALKRNTMRTVQLMDLPEESVSAFLDQAILYMEDAKCGTAIRAFSLTLFARHTILYPDLKRELKMIIKDQINTGTVGWHSICRKHLARL